VVDRACAGSGGRGLPAGPGPAVRRWSNRAKGVVVSGLLAERPSLLLLTLLTACAHGRDDFSGADAERTGAAVLALDTIADDAIDVDAGDATDWRYVEVEKPGQLGVQLRWDDPQRQLTLALADALGKVVAEGETWDNNGRQIVFNATEPGRYYVRVAGPETADRITYSLKVAYQRVASGRCFDCVVGAQTCVGKDGFAVCETTKEGCNAWVQVQACPATHVCYEGQCREGCQDQCKAEERRCASGTATQVCVRGPAGCLVWNEPILCEGGTVCSPSSFRCKKPEAGSKPIATAKPAAEVLVRGTIVSSFAEGASRMLHIRVGEGHNVTAGTRGSVLEGETDKPLESGEITVVSVAGAFVKAQTTLATVGNNRKVVFRLKP
jgi:hypothetical protein